MAKNTIVQHRRGTTEEWLAFEGMPYEGEIVIEECANGELKYKIGTGKHLYKDLPYPTAPIENQIINLRAQLNTVSSSVNDRLSGLSAQLASLTDDHKTSNSLLTGQLAGLTSMVADQADATEALDKKVKGIDRQTSDLDTRFDNVELAVAEAKIGAEAVRQEVRAQSQNITELAAQTNKHVSNISAEVSTLKKDVAKVMTTAEEISLLSARLSVLNQEVLTHTHEAEQTRATLNKVVDDQQQETTKILGTIDTILADIRDLSLADINFKLQLEDIASRIGTAAGNGSTTNLRPIESALASVIESVSELDAQLQHKETLLQKAINVLESRTQELSTKVTQQSANIYALDSAVKRLTTDTATAAETTGIKITAMLSQIHSLEVVFSEAQQFILDVTPRLSVIEAFVTKNEGGSALTKVSALEKTTNASIVALQEVAAELTTLVQNCRSDIERLFDDIDLIRLEATRLADQIVEVDTSSSENYGEVKVLISQLAAKLEALKATDNEATKAIVDINSRLGALNSAQTMTNLNITSTRNRVDAVEVQVSKLLTDFTELSNGAKVDIANLKTTLSIINVDVRQAIEAGIFATSYYQATKSQLDTIENTLTERLATIQGLKLRMNVVEAHLTLLHNNQETFVTDLVNVANELENRVTPLEEQAVYMRAELKSHAAQISQFTSLADGGVTTAGDEELMNMRIDHEGTLYASAGEAMRSIGRSVLALQQNKIKTDADIQALEQTSTAADLALQTAIEEAVQQTTDLQNSLAQYIDRDAVDGILCEDTTLFLTANGSKVSAGTPLPPVITGLTYKDNLLQLVANDKPVGEPVHISGGGGGGGQGSGSSYVTLRDPNGNYAFTAAKGSAALLRFNFSSVEDGVPTGNGTCMVVVNDKTVKTYPMPQGENTIDVMEYLRVSSEPNVVRITVTDRYGNSRFLEYYITVIQLSVTAKLDLLYSDKFTFKYTPYGAISKVAHFLIDDVEIGTQTVETSGEAKTFDIPKQSHGTHVLKVFLTAELNNETVKSNQLSFEFISRDDSSIDSDRAAIAMNCTATEIVQGDLISIPFRVFDKAALAYDVKFIIRTMINGVLTDYSSTDQTVTASSKPWETRSYPAGIVYFVIQYTYMFRGELTTIERAHQVKVLASSNNIVAETDNLQLYLSAQGRSNDEKVPNQWNYNGITTTFKNFNWKSNGWIPDAKGDTCLRLTGDARATIHFKPFEEDFKINGKTLEFEFAVRDVNRRDAVVLKCMVGDIGFQATADTAALKAEGTTVSCNYKEEERIRVSFTVEDGNSVDSNRFVSTFLNGTLSGIAQYGPAENFSQTPAAEIEIGSPSCGIDLYSVRIYNKSLSSKQMTTNYIADMKEPKTQEDLIIDNDIYDEQTGLISYRKVKQRIPTVTFIGKMPKTKGDKKEHVRMIFEHPTNPSLNFDEILKSIDVQGTSSAGYARKNWKTKHKNAHMHMEGELPAKVFCLKVDYAEATGTHNTQNANLVETFYTEAIPPKNNLPLTLTPDEVAEIKKVRTTITGFPIAIFELALDTEDDAILNAVTQEDLVSTFSTQIKFSSKGNFNYDKGAEDVFAFNDNYDVECWEFTQNCDQTSFLTPWPAANHPEFWEARYHAKLGELEDLQDAGNDEAARKLQDQMIVRFKEMYEWVHSTARGSYTDAAGQKHIFATGKKLATPYTDAFGTNFTHDTDEYRLAKFKSEFANYFNMHYTVIYYVYTFFGLMVDQRAKNLFLTYWHDDAYDNDSPGHWYPYFYDNDTSYGVNNVGQLVFDYFHEDTDTINDGTANVYNGQNSILWCNFRDAFPEKIQETYASLRNSGRLTYDKIINQFVNAGSDQWSAAMYNEDAWYKYVSIATPDSDYDATGDGIPDQIATYLYQVRGDGKEHLKYFVENRLRYCDSKWHCSSYAEDRVQVRIYTPSANENAETIKVVPPKADITVTPYSDMYAGVSYGAASGDDPMKFLKQVRLKKNQKYTFDAGSSTVNDKETYIYGASQLSSLGDLAPLYPGLLDVSAAKKLIELKVGDGNPAYTNPNLRSVTLGANKLLREIDVQNCPGLKNTLDLSGCDSIEKIYARGSGLSSITLPPSGYVKVLELPETITNLTLQNQGSLENLHFDNYRGLKTLVIENCPKLDSVAILNNCKHEFFNRLSLPETVRTEESATNTMELFIPGKTTLSISASSFSKNDTAKFVVLDRNFKDCGLESSVLSKDTIRTVVFELEEGNYHLCVEGDSAQIFDITLGITEVIEEEDKTLTEKLTTTHLNIGEIYNVANGHSLSVALGDYLDPDAKYIRFHGEYVVDYKQKLGYTLSRVRLTDLNWNMPNVEFLRTLYDIGGINEQNINQPYAWLVGKCHITELSGKEYAEVKERFPYLDITFDKLSSKLTFMAADCTTVVNVQNIVSSSNKAGDGVCPVTSGLTDYVPHMDTTAEFTYTWCGWSRTPGSTTKDADALIAITSDRVLYPAFERTRRKYDISFYNGNTHLATISTEYGSTASYPYLDLVRPGAYSDLYECVGWSPSPAPEGGITGPMNCFAQFSIIDEKYYTIDSQNINYAIVGDELTVTKYNNYLASAVRVPETLSVDDFNYKIVEVGGFGWTYGNPVENLIAVDLADTISAISDEAFLDRPDLVEFKLPAALETIGASAFRGCKGIETISIPSGVTYIGESAFGGCGALQTIEVDPGNTHYEVRGNCLIEKSTGKIKGAGHNPVIPQDGSIKALTPYCFSQNQTLTTLNIPQGVKTISANLCNWCTNLTEVILPDSVTEIAATAFGWCGSLKTVTLPSKLTKIKTYAFNGTDIKEIVIPATVTEVLMNAFGQDSSTGDKGLRKITFLGKPDKIDKAAFKYCKNLEIYVPWAAGEVAGEDTFWGATSATIHRTT